MTSQQEKTMKIDSTWVTHQGGTVTVTATGLVHKAGNSYSGKALHQTQQKEKDNVL